MRCGVLMLLLRLFWGVPGSLSAKTSYVRMMHFWQIVSGVQYNVMACANIGSKP